MAYRLGYLPALDGLRAVAVAMVVAYHLDLPWATGGFLGVDVFFVISGFLITSLMLENVEQGSGISLIAFWARRFKRLVPAIVVMVAATLVATRRWGLPEQWDSVRVDGIASLAYVANWRFIVDQQSYFEAALGPSPLLHTWSLAVEEQWYLLWPVVMLALVAVAGRHRHGVRIAAALVGIGAVASALWMAVLYVPADPSRVYFGTDTRAQQLLVGAALAWLIRCVPTIAELADDRRFRLPFALGLGVLVVASSVLDDDTAWLYRGGLLGLSVVAAVVVAGTLGSSRGALGWLGWAPLVWLGKRSYGIYLWHWPVIVFVGAPMGVGLDGAALIALQLLVTLALATGSHHLIESPVRRSTRPASRTVAVWSVGALAVAAIGFVGLRPPSDRLLSSSSEVFPDLPTTPRDDAATSAETDAHAEADAAAAASGDPARSGADAAGPVDVLLLGDSAAYTLGESLDRDAWPEWRVQGFAQFGCPITPGQTLDGASSVLNPLGDECVDDWRQTWTEFARVLQPDIAVVMIGAWEVLDHRVDGEAIRFGTMAWDDLVRDAIESAIAAADSTGIPVVIADVPCMGGGSANQGTSSRTESERVDAVNALIADIADGRPDVVVAPVSTIVCPSGSPDVEVDGTPVRYDGVHYTPAGAALVWPELFDIANRMLRAEPAGG